MTRNAPAPTRCWFCGLAEPTLVCRLCKSAKVDWLKPAVRVGDAGPWEPSFADEIAAAQELERARC